MKLKIMALVLLFVLMGCSQTEVQMPTDKSITTVENPILQKFNSMLKVFRGKPLAVAIADMENETGTPKLPNLFNTIVKKSFNDIGDMVNVVVDGEKYDDKGGTYYGIHGAITEFYVSKTIAKGYTGDIDIEKNDDSITGSASLDKEDKVSHIAITFNPENLRTGVQVPRCSVANKMTIYQKSNANEFGFSIFGSGIGYNKTITKAQGIDEAIVTLVDVNTIEVLGKLTDSPYWILIKKRPNMDIVNRLTRNFIREKPYQKLYKISYLLTLRGYYSHATYTMKNNGLKEAIKKYKKSHGMMDNASISSKLYRSLLTEA